MTKKSSHARDRFLIEVVRLLAALIHKVAAQLHVAPLARSARKLDQRQLDLGVPAVAALLARPWPKHAADMIGVATEHIQKCALAGGFVVRDRGLEEMA